MLVAVALLLKKTVAARKALLALAFAAIAFPAWGMNKVTVLQLEQTVAEVQNIGDRAAADRLT